MDEQQLQYRIEQLRKVGVFSEIEEHLLKEIAPMLTDESVRKQQNIFKKGDEGDALYIITKGKVRVHDGNHVLSRLGSFDVFGEYSLIDDKERSASVTAEEPTELLRLTRDDFEDLLSRRVGIAKGILQVLIQRMRYMNELEEKLAKSYLKIQKQKREIEDQSENINEQKLMLEEQNFDLLNFNEEKNHLISVVVHGLKNPLTSSICMAEMLMQSGGKLSEDQVQYVEIILKSLGRMSKMINQILDVNVIDSKILDLKFEKINLKSIIESIHTNHKPTFDQKEQEIDLDLDDILVELNEVYILQVVDNLFSNAVKFTPNGKNIWISLKRVNDNALLIIKDEGIGISFKDCENIFTMYQPKKHHLRQDEPDPGLGLAIVKKYVTAMNGMVWCESEEGKGSSFYVEFPLDS
ncbi:MAG: ATP-binding protein [Bacteroidota bacterium]|nr:ATP-binding protein [Bacteroidota bacterium]